MGVRCLCKAKMVLTILLLTLVLSSLTDAGADAESSPKLGLEDLEDLVEKLVESRLRDMETRMQNDKEKQAKEKKELEAKIKDMEMRLEELEDNMKEEKDELEASKLRMEVEEESSRKESASNNALTNPSLRDLPIIIISAYRDSSIGSPQTVTFDSFLANFNNGNRPGGGSGVLDLDSGVFTCFTPGYYTVSFSAHGVVEPDLPKPTLYLYMNGSELPESKWYLTHNGAVDTYVGVTGSRVLILHMDAGDTLELRMTEGNYISQITLNIELIGLGFD